MNNKVKWTKCLIACLMVIAMITALAACGGSTPATTAAPAETTASGGGETAAPADTTPAETEEVPTEHVYTEVKVGVASDSMLLTGAFDPCGAFAPIMCGDSKYLYYDVLIFTNNDNQYDSKILKEWHWEDDNTLVMTLKDDVYFSNGEQMTGDDVLYSYQLVSTSKIPILGAFAQMDLDQCTVSDDKMTVTFVYPNTYPCAEAFLQMPIICKSFVESHGDGADLDWYSTESLCGSGPYTVTDFDYGVSATYELRDDYWGFAEGYTYDADKLICTYYADENALMADLQTGAVDIALNIGESSYSRVKNGEVADCEVVLTPINSNFFIQFSSLSEPLKDPKLREALCHAIDADAIRENIVGVMGTTAQCKYAKNQMGYVEGLTYEYDPELAKQLLKEAGYNEGDLTLKFTHMGMPTTTKLGELLNAYLGAIGVTVNIETVDTATWYSTMGTAGFTDICTYYITGGCPSGDTGLEGYWTSGSSNPNLQLDYADQYAEIFTGTTDKEVRVKAYEDFAKAIYDNFSIIPLWEENYAYAYNTNTIADVGIYNSIWNLNNVKTK